MRTLLGLLAALLLPGLAHAADAQLHPDRPAVGESPGTPGAGYFNLEAGLATTLGEGQVVPQTQAVTLRFGVDDHMELRATVPDLILVDGTVELGPLGLGFKIASGVGERFTVSAVPTFLVDLDDGGAGWQLSANGGFQEGRVAVWLNATTTVLDGDVSVFGGGGASLNIDSGGIYVNAGRYVTARTSLLGGGGWWRLDEGVQIDAGMDLLFVGPDLYAVPMLGASFAF